MEISVLVLLDETNKANSRMATYEETKMTNPKKKPEWMKRFIIKVGSMGGQFIGEHGMIHEPTLLALIEELDQIINKERKKEGREVLEEAGERLINKAVSNADRKPYIASIIPPEINDIISNLSDKEYRERIRQNI